MASTSAFVLEERQQHIIAPDDSDFLDSDAESTNTSHPDDHLIESAVLEDVQSTPHRSSRTTRNKSPAKLWPSHPLIRIHKRLWFTWFPSELPSEEDLNEQDGQSAAWKNFNDAEIKKYVDPSETKPSRLHWFNIDRDLVYLSFWFDWGPSTSACSTASACMYITCSPIQTCKMPPWCSTPPMRPRKRPMQRCS